MPERKPRGKPISINKGGRPPDVFPKKCSENGCTKNHYSKGFCHAHYNKNYLETHIIMQGVPHSQLEAQEQKRTFYVSKERCPICFTTAKWAHDNSCMGYHHSIISQEK